MNLKGVCVVYFMETIWRMLAKGSLFSFSTIRQLGRQNTHEVKGSCLLDCPATGALHELVKQMENLEVRAGNEGRGGEEMDQQEVWEVATL